MTRMNPPEPNLLPDPRGTAPPGAPDDPDEPLIEVSDLQSHHAVDPARARAWARLVLTSEGRAGARLSIALVDNRAIHEINRKFLGHDWPTDVVTFPHLEDAASALSGELVISTEMAVEQAVEQQVSVERELALYVIHGVLHLCGYDDTSPAQVAVMRAREAAYLAECARQGLVDQWATPGGVACQE